MAKALTEYEQRLSQAVLDWLIEFYDQYDHKLCFYRQSDDGPNLIRSMLDEEFSDASSTQIRNAVHRNSGKFKKGRRKQKTKSAASRIVGIASRERGNVEHSPEYLSYMQSEEWEARRLKHIQDVGRRCQVCNTAGPLDVHHRHYNHPFDGSEHWSDLIACCSVTCHPVLDTLRRAGVSNGQQTIFG